MKLKTLVPVTYNSGIAGQETSIVEGILTSCNQQLASTFDSMYMFQYVSEEGQVISSNLYPVTEEETNALYDLVKDEVPTGLSYTDATTYLYYLGFRVKMAITFGIEVSEIEIIIE
jgi:hypothetical protein